MEKSSRNIANILGFLHQAEKLKSVLRHSWLSSGRRESVAEHTWRMALLAMAVFPHLQKKNRPDLGKTLQMIVIHDLCEVYAGDVWAFQDSGFKKHILEKKSLQKITRALGRTQKDILALWQEYEDALTNEARLAKACDKLEAIVQHLEAGMKHNYRREYRLNLTYGIRQTEYDPFLRELRLRLKQEFIRLYERHNINPKYYA